MKTHLVALPDDAFYELIQLAKYLQDRHSATPEDVQGLGCITRKLPARFTLDRSPQFLYRNKQFIGRQELTEDDKKILCEILPSLPPVTNFMTYEEIDRFFEGYYKIDKRPRWEPDIMTPADRKKKRLDYERSLDTYCQRFAELAEKGLVTALDSKFDIVSIKNSSPKYIEKRKLLVTKQDAITYLTGYGLKVSFKPESTEKPQVPSEPAKRRTKADLLSTVIEDLYKQHGQDSEDNKLWLEVTKMAATATHPFKSYAKDVIYCGDESKWLINRKSFMARLSRRKKAQSLRSV